MPHEFFDKHEERIKNKFEEEKERVIQAFKTIKDKLEDKEKEFIEMMKDQMEKELASLKTKWEKKWDLETHIEKALEEIEECKRSHLLFTDGENFLREKEFQLKKLLLLKEISIPS